jgi:hypothetical protein
MEDPNESLEERAKEFFKLNPSFNSEGFNPAKMNNLNEHTEEIYYLFLKGYIREVGDTVKTFRYVSTVDGRKWALE